jgi:hypothetical protein
MNDASHETLQMRLNSAVRPAADPDWRDVVARAAAPPPVRASGLQRIGAFARRQTLLFAFGLAALLVPPAFAVGYLVLKSSPPVASPVVLPPLPAGWTLVANSGQHLKSAKNTNVETLITSWRYHPTSNGPASVIPPGGIMIGVTLSRDQRYGARKLDLCETTARLPQFPPRSLPLTLPRTTSDTLDGQPHVEEFRVLGRYRDSYNFEIRVDIDARRPIGPRWAQAETITRRLRLPRWPVAKAC